MTTLPNFPMLNQRTTITANGQRDVNADFDCVAESIAAAMTWMTGKHFEGGVLKELIYGTSYQGGTDAHAYVQYCMQHGVKLSPLQGDNATLVQLAHQHIKLGHPCLLTEIDPYIDLTLYPGSTHVVCAYEEDAGSVTVMDPFGGYSVTKTDYQWQNVLQFGEIWIFEKIETEEQVAISLSTAGVSDLFVAAPGGNWHCKSTNCTIGGAILTYYRTLGNAGLCGLTVLGLPTSNEYSMGIQGHPEIVAQDFEHADVTYNPQHIGGAPRGAGPVFVLTQKIHNEDIKQALAQVIDLQHKIASIVQICKA